MSKTKIFRVILCILFLISLSISSRTVQATETSNLNKNPSDRRVVKIAVKSSEDMKELVNIVEPWEIHKDYIITDATEKIIQKITNKGYSVEILFESREDFLNFYGITPPQAGDEGLYHSYTEMKNELQQLELAYPQIAKVYDIGDSWNKTQGTANRDILAIKISDYVTEDEDEPEILFTGCHHAREWISVEIPIYLAKYLVENYHIDPLIKSYVDNGEIWIIPMLNPDGHQYSIDVDRLWRKNRRNNRDGSFGVDLNRNYSFMWGGTGSSGNPRSDIYRGTMPFSEPETQAVRELTLNHNFRAVVNYHSYGQKILYPWGYTLNPPSDEQLFLMLSQNMADFIQSEHGKIYTPMQGSYMYFTSGTADDWFYGEYEIVSFTVELRPKGYPYFELPEDEIIPTWEENRPAALSLINWSQLPPNPVPEAKINNQDGVVQVSHGENLIVTISLEAASHAGVHADWWFMVFYKETSIDLWEPLLIWNFQSPLFGLPPVDIFNTPDFNAGIWLFVFGVDINPNTILDNPGYLDFGAVIVQ